jgi:hypothetical protein
MAQMEIWKVYPDIGQNEMEYYLDIRDYIKKRGLFLD